MNMALSQCVKDAIRQELDAVVALRHDLHKNPELSFQEERTSQVVEREIDRLGIAYKANMAGGTGVVAFIPSTEVGEDTPSVALRADMDALPITEQTGLS